MFARSDSLHLKPNRVGEFTRIIRIPAHEVA